MTAREYVPVIRFGALGDLIVTLPLLRRLREHYGYQCLLIGTGWWPEPVCRGNTDVGRVISLSRHLPSLLDPAWWSAVAALRRCRNFPVYDICETSRAQDAARLLAAAGVEQGRRLTHRERAAPDDHSIERVLRAGGNELGVTSELKQSAPAVPNFVVFEHERKTCAIWLQRRGIWGKPLVLIQTGNRRTMGSMRRRHRRLNRDDKAWPIENWRQLLRAAHDRLPEAAFLLCGAPPEEKFLHEIQAATALDCVMPAVLDLRSLFALFEIAHSMISIDTGPAHAAAALNVPLVVMFGSQSRDRWLPRSAGSPVVGVGGPPEMSRVDEIPVAAVFERWCQLTEVAQLRCDKSQE
ncbi:MAG: hypothetical protein GJU76_13080 [Gallionella sp.]|nr:hypothetical protein [Gallionella sp.]